MFICQLGMHNNVQGHRNAKVCKQTYDACCSPTSCFEASSRGRNYRSDQQQVQTSTLMRSSSLGLTGGPSEHSSQPAYPGVYGFTGAEALEAHEWRRQKQQVCDIETRLTARPKLGSCAARKDIHNDSL